MKQIKIYILAILLCGARIPVAFANEAVHSCRTAWNDKMQAITVEYQKGLRDTVFQKKTTTSILEKKQITDNLRTYECRMYQICGVVEKSFQGDKNGVAAETLVDVQPWRCQPKTVAELGGFLNECKKNKLPLGMQTNVLWQVCKEQAEERIQTIQLLTLTETRRGIVAKKTSNFVAYLKGFNQELNTLTLDFGEMIGKLFSVTKKLTCVQRYCQ